MEQAQSSQRPPRNQLARSNTLKHWDVMLMRLTVARTLVTDTRLEVWAEEKARRCWSERVEACSAIAEAFA